MAHFAQIENGAVSQVIVINNETINDLDFPESEPVGQEFISSLGIDGTWIECSYNDNFRGIYPGIGYTWDGVNFVSPEGDL